MISDDGRLKFMPAEFKLTETRQPPLKDMYDEWLARVICYAFSVPASAFVSEVNRATSETLRVQAATEGPVPLKAWVKMVFDRVIAVGFGSPDCEFAWVGDDAVDPLQQAQTIAILVGAGVKTVAEARVELGLGPGAGVVKFNPNHDELGLFTTAEGAVGSGQRSPLVAPIASTMPDNTPGGFKLNDKAQRRMRQRGWSADQIDEAVQRGNRIDAINRKTGSPATRYVNPNTGASVVIDNTTREVIQVGKPDFEFGPDSGDVPGAIMRPPPIAPNIPIDPPVAPLDPFVDPVIPIERLL